MVWRVFHSSMQLFREALMKRGFQEIHTPKLTAGSSEGGANVFKLLYFGRDACLAQSPQFFKQMAIMSGMKRVFEIGPVFRFVLSCTLSPLVLSHLMRHKLLGCTALHSMQQVQAASMLLSWSNICLS